MGIERRVGDQLIHRHIEGLLISTDGGYGVRIEHDKGVDVFEFDDIEVTDIVMKEAAERLWREQIKFRVST